MVLDALAEDEEGRLINVEMHPQEDEDHVRRVRYHLSGIDMSYLEKGNDFEAIPEVYLIYITKKDFIGRNKGINEIIRIVDGTGTILDNGVHELYVNFEHCILAHHGELEYGSPKKPALIEALALNLADNADAKLETMSEILKGAGDNMGWLGYNRFMESNVRRTGEP